jgi:hypothetical protein
MANEQWHIFRGSRTLKIDGVTVSGVTAAILNALTTAGLSLLNALTATADEINRQVDSSLRFMSTTATTLSLTVASHGGKILRIATNSSSGFTGTLPPSTGSGERFFLVNNPQTQGNITINTATTTDVMKGKAFAFDSAATTTHQSFFRTATATQVQLNRTTKGGIGEDELEFYDEAAGQWMIRVLSNCSGAPATPFV